MLQSAGTCCNYAWTPSLQRQCEGDITYTLRKFRSLLVKGFVGPLKSYVLARLYHDEFRCEFREALFLGDAGGGSRIKYPWPSRAQTMLHMRIDWVHSESTFSIRLVKVFFQIFFSAKVATLKQIRRRCIICWIGLNKSSLIARRWSCCMRS